jgi:SP family sugar:H+ symporter-like MFS transporter
MLKKLGLPRLRPENRFGDQNPPATTNDGEKGHHLVDTPIPLLTWRSFVMGILVSMGGFIFGYDTGQISGFLEMKDFLERFGEPGPNGKYHFTNARSGVIVALVSVSLEILLSAIKSLTWDDF